MIARIEQLKLHEEEEWKAVTKVRKQREKWAAVKHKNLQPESLRIHTTDLILKYDVRLTLDKLLSGTLKLQ